MNCQMLGCLKEATGALAINVPAMHCPIPEHDPIRLVLGLTLCEQHLAEADLRDFLCADSRLEQIVRIQARGRAEPDFARAFTSVVRFDDPEWLPLQKARQGGGRP